MSDDAALAWTALAAATASARAWSVASVAARSAARASPSLRRSEVFSAFTASSCSFSRARCSRAALFGIGELGSQPLDLLGVPFGPLGLQPRLDSLEGTREQLLPALRSQQPGQGGDLRRVRGRRNQAILQRGGKLGYDDRGLHGDVPSEVVVSADRQRDLAAAEPSPPGRRELGDALEGRRQRRDLRQDLSRQRDDPRPHCFGQLLDVGSLG